MHCLEQIETILPYSKGTQVLQGDEEPAKNTFRGDRNIEVAAEEVVTAREGEGKTAGRAVALRGTATTTAPRAAAAGCNAGASESKRKAVLTCGTHIKRKIAGNNCSTIETKKSWGAHGSGWQHGGSSNAEKDGNVNQCPQSHCLPEQQEAMPVSRERVFGLPSGKITNRLRT